MANLIEGTITALTAELIRIIGPAGKKGLTRQEITEQCNDATRVRVLRALGNAVQRKQIVLVARKGQSASAYVLGSAWADLFTRLDKLKVVDVSTKSKRKFKKKASDIEPAPEPELPVNVSPEANNFADYATALIAQNAEYRSTLLSVYNLIGKLLNQPGKEN